MQTPLPSHLFSCWINKAPLCTFVSFWFLCPVRPVSAWNANLHLSRDNYWEPCENKIAFRIMSYKMQKECKVHWNLFQMQWEVLAMCANIWCKEWLYWTYLQEWTQMYISTAEKLVFNQQHSQQELLDGLKPNILQSDVFPVVPEISNSPYFVLDFHSSSFSPEHSTYWGLAVKKTCFIKVW